jgi:acylpyruvate hydrolase
MRSVVLKDASEAIPVGKILCLGRNYAEHVKEMKAEIPERPPVFLKPSTALIQDGENVAIPSLSKDVHYEVELVVLIGKAGKDIPRESAYHHVAGYGVGLDMTLRDIQAEAKKRGLPWSVAKGFDTSAPVSTFAQKTGVPDPHNLILSLKVNGRIRQRSTTANMIFRIDEIISYVSSLFTLEPGDLVFTGTPEGVGPVTSGDTLEAELEGVATLHVGVV